MRNKQNIYFVHNSRTKFVDIDVNILSKHHTLVEECVENPLKFLRIIKNIYKCDIVLCWFASWHSLIPMILAYLLGRKTILITGGYDTAKITAANYGNQLYFHKRFLTNLIIKIADTVICNSEFTKRETILRTGISESKINVVYHGLDTVKISTLVKHKIALNVGNLFEENLLRKGILPFIQSAKYAPSYRFIHVGKVKDKGALRKVQKFSRDNVEIRGYLSDSKLVEIFECSELYIQPSLHEGFGLSVLEAMQYGCVPIVSPNGALPELIGDSGIILEDASPESIGKVINRLGESEIRRFSEKAVCRSNSFTLAKREEGLLKVIDMVLDN